MLKIGLVNRTNRKGHDSRNVPFMKNNDYDSKVTSLLKKKKQTNKKQNTMLAQSRWA